MLWFIFFLLLMIYSRSTRIFVCVGYVAILALITYENGMLWSYVAIFAIIQIILLYYYRHKENERQKIAEQKTKEKQEADLYVQRLLRVMKDTDNLKKNL